MNDSRQQASAPDPQHQPRRVVARRTVAPGHTAVWWVIAASLAVIALCLVLRLDDANPRNAFAQSVERAGARGVFAFTGQLTKNSFGVFMVDVDAGTVWCYEYVGSGNGLRLVAARDWRFDRYLKDFSTEPSVEAVRKMVEDQRAAELQDLAP